MTERSRHTATTGPPIGAAPTTAMVAVNLAIVYVIWGSTYLAIKIAIETIPPLLMAGTRFLLAGTALYLWAIRHGDRADRPTREHWRSAFVIGGLLLVGGNGAVTLAEQRVDSGVAALLVASVPLWMALIVWLRTRARLGARAAVGLLLGFAGVAVLVQPGAGEAPVHLPSAGLILVGALSWAYGSVRAPELTLPARPLLSTAMQMLAAVPMFLVLGTARGELGALDLGAISGRSALGVLYLAVFGSVIAFSAYGWLLKHVSSSTASTYAYVNPAVAVVLGWAVLGEVLDARTFLATGVIVVAVAIIVSARTARPFRARSGTRLRPRTTD